MRYDRFRDRLTYAVGYVGEFAFVTGALTASLLLAAVVLGGIDPLDSPLIISTWLAVTVISACHHIWYHRHEHEITSSPAHRHDRERRGY